MATAVVAFIGTKAVDAESTTGWNTGNLDNDIFQEGSGSIGAKVSNTTSDFYDLSVTGSPYDFSSGGADEGDHIFAWFNTLTPATLHAIIAADDLATDSVGCWNVGPPTGYGGGWISYVIDPAADFDTIIAAGSGSWTTTGNPAQLTGVDGFGGRHTTSTSIMGNFNNALVDAVSIGTGYRITRGDGASTPGDFANLITYERTTSNRFGGLRSTGGVLFMLSKIIVGDTTANDHAFDASGFTVVWLDAPVATTFYEFSAEEGTGTTTVTLTNGTLKAETTTQSGKPLMDFSGITSWTNTNVNIIGARAFNLDSNVTITNGTWESGGQIDLGGQPTITGLTILDPTDDGALLVNAVNELANVSDITFDGAGVGGTSTDAAIEIDITGAGPFTLDFDNIKFQNRVSGSVDVHILANNNADYTINVLNGGDTPTVTNDGTGTVTVVNAVNLTITVQDEDGNAIQDAQVAIYDSSDTQLMNEDTTVAGIAQESYAYVADEDITIRVRKTSPGTTRYFPNQSSGTITSTGFSATVTLIQDTIASA